MRSFFGAQIGEQQTAFGEFQHTNLAYILLVKLNGKIFAERFALPNFCLAHKGWCH
jgi:hypothetical protein